MPNTYFRFKQFTVCHEKCAMKVGTDGVLLGAWTDADSCQSALDVGVGSGLVALMLAQRYHNLVVDAIDIDKDAVDQAIENVTNSPFSHINCYHASLQDWAKVCDKKYDLIVSNPPFFSSSLKSPKHQRTLARHTDSLPMEDFIPIVESILSDAGRFSFIYPYSEKALLLEIADRYHLKASRITNVLPKAGVSPKRVLMELRRKPTENIVSENDLIIEKDRHIYTDEFTGLVKDFYLKM
ncbi:tRNA1(Val) (adenine(37)-N6)-methyltransferase [Dysgonomonas sp. 520]|uniref:tRNA1(Val) (adenine(37)-N6)-methyltransferase n=1 Tax=Dysgonomonas sp. 520 TaxID=2302931 RepID=UPI0013D3500A|nr:methyltransferase [Dysgonomonas sp. 520]NDW09287.1 methyltransferase domain-containing protein [Dysgonomonas sp. 520]